MYGPTDRDYVVLALICMFLGYCALRVAEFVIRYLLAHLTWV